jgi:hypothetical protein
VPQGIRVGCPGSVLRSLPREQTGVLDAGQHHPGTLPSRALATTAHAALGAVAHRGPAVKGTISFHGALLQGKATSIPAAAPGSGDPGAGCGSLPLDRATSVPTVVPFDERAFNGRPCPRGSLFVMTVYAPRSALQRVRPAARFEHGERHRPRRRSGRLEPTPGYWIAVPPRPGRAVPCFPRPRGRNATPRERRRRTDAARCE